MNLPVLCKHMLNPPRPVQPIFFFFFTIIHCEAAGPIFTSYGGQEIAHRPLLYVTVLQSVAMAISGSSRSTLICGCQSRARRSTVQTHRYLAQAIRRITSLHLVRERAAVHTSRQLLKDLKCVSFVTK